MKLLDFPLGQATQFCSFLATPFLYVPGGHGKVGDGEGWCVGTGDGSGVGIGEIEGSIVGNAVGLRVGTAVGSSVGTSVGSPEGFLVDITITTDSTVSRT